MDLLIQVQHWFISTIDFPAIVLLLLFTLGVWVLWRTQQRQDFDMADMLKDDKGKPSMSHLFGMGCFAVSSWALMYMLIKNGGKIDTMLFLGYVLIFSGTPVATKAIDAYVARNQFPSYPPAPPAVVAVESQVKE